MDILNLAMARHLTCNRLTLFLSLGLSLSAHGQVFENRIRFQNGSSPVVNGNRFEILSSSGQKAGSNLFHSFSDFNVAAGSSAVFKAPAATSNIIARVTGGNPSAIDGTLRTELENSSALSGANLYLLNPSGILFGPNAKLEIGGSFTASTADYVKLKDGGRFDARDQARDLLTTAPISAFGFLGPNAPAAVRLTGSRLAVPAGRNLSVIAGDTTLESGAQLQAPSGALSFFSAAAAGELPFDEAAPAAHFADAAFTAFGRFSLTGGSSARIDGAGGGLLSVRAATLTLEGSSALSSVNSGATAGGDLNILADSVSVLGGSRIAASALAAGKAGDVHVRAVQLTVDGDDGVGASSIRSHAEEGSGDGGNLDVRAQAIVLSNGGYLSTGTYSAGNGGNLNVAADLLDIHGSTDVGGASGIFAHALGGSSGMGGTITLQAGTISISSGGEIAASTYSSGHGGSLNLQAGSLTIDGSATPTVFTGIAVNSAPGATGDAGDILANLAGAVTVTGRGTISASAFSSGHGGNLTLQANSLTIDGSTAPNLFTGLTVDSELGATGNGGRLQVNILGKVSLAGGGQITASTFSPGHGGDVTLQANSLVIDGSATPTNFTGIAANSSRGALGDGGSLELNVAGAVAITGAGEISANTFSPGHGGDLFLRAKSLVIDGSATPAQFTGITVDSTSGATGAAGDLNVNISDTALVIGRGEITASTYSSGKGGNLLFQAQSLTIDGSALPNRFTGIAVNSNPGAQGDGGRLEVNVGGVISIAGTGTIAAATFSSGHGGDLLLRAGSLVIDGSATPGLFTGIAANSERGATGDGGRLDIDVANVVSITGSGEIAAATRSSGHGGDLTLHANSLVIDGSTTPTRFTGITVNSNAGATGDAGTLSINIEGDAHILGAGQITADTSSSGKGGDLIFQANTLLIDGSLAPDAITGISTEAVAGTGHGGNITISIAASARILGTGVISTSTSSTGNGGNLRLHAASLLIDGSANQDYFTGILTEASDGTGDAGSLEINVATLARIVGGGGVSSNTYTSGRGGNLTFRAGSLLIDGAPTPDLVTGISADAQAGTGNAGDVVVQISGLARLVSGGAITADTYTSGNGGGVRFHAQELFIDGRGAPDGFTGIGTVAHEGSGNAGDLNVQVANGVTITRGGQLSSGTFSSGRGGNLTLQANSLMITGDRSLGLTTGIDAQSNSGAGGYGGDILVNITRAVTIHGGGEISASTFSSGHGGNLTLTANTLAIDGSSALEKFTGLTAQSNPGATGAAGNLAVSAQDITLTNNGKISSESIGSGDGGSVYVRAGHSLSIASRGIITAGAFDRGSGGDVRVVAGSILIDGRGAPGQFTGISAESGYSATGDGGTVRVEAGRLALVNFGEIAAAAFGLGNAGDVEVEVRERLALSGGSYLASTSLLTSAGGVAVSAGGDIDVGASFITVRANQGDAGDIIIETPSTLNLQRSSVIASANGNGGNITLRTGFLELNGSTVTANAVNGNGGSITLDLPAAGVFGDARDFVVASPFILQSSDSRISASSTFGLQGALLISAPFVDLAGSLEALPTLFFDASSELRDECMHKTGKKFSTYQRLGRGGQAPQPDELGASYGN